MHYYTICIRSKIQIYFKLHICVFQYLNRVNGRMWVIKLESPPTSPMFCWWRSAMRYLSDPNQHYFLVSLFSVTPIRRFDDAQYDRKKNTTTDLRQVRVLRMICFSLHAHILQFVFVMHGPYVALLFFIVIKMNLLWTDAQDERKIVLFKLLRTTAVKKPVY